MNQSTARRYASGIRELARKRGVAEAFRFWSDYRKLKRELERKLAPIAARHRVDSPGVAYQKYLEVDYWLFENLRRVFALGLDRHPLKLKEKMPL
jgi:hypothetical protein